MIPVPFNVVTDNGGSWTTFPTSALANATTDTDSGLSEDQSYEYRVCATNAAGNSAYTMAAYATTQPKAPTGLSAAFVSGGEIDLTWTVNSSSAYYYSVEHSTDGGATWTAEPALVYPSGVSPGGTYTYADPGPFDPASAYSFRVRAYSYYGGYSGYSNIATAATTAYPVAPPGCRPPRCPTRRSN